MDSIKKNVEPRVSELLGISTEKDYIIYKKYINDENLNTDEEETLKQNGKALFGGLSSFYSKIKEEDREGNKTHFFETEDHIEKIKREFKNPGLAFEYFLMFSLKNSYTAPKEMDSEGIDIFLNMFGSVIGTQITTSSNEQTLRDKLIKEQETLKEIDKSKVKFNFISKYRSDILSLMVVNGELANLVKSENRLGHLTKNIFLIAFEKWEENNFNGELIDYFDIKQTPEVNELLVISKSMPDVEKVLEEFLKKENLLKNHETGKKFENDSYQIFLDFDEKNGIVNIEVYENGKENSLYYINFFLTDKITSKLKINLRIHNDRKLSSSASNDNIDETLIFENEIIKQYEHIKENSQIDKSCNLQTAILLYLVLKGEEKEISRNYIEEKIIIETSNVNYFDYTIILEILDHVNKDFLELINKGLSKNYSSKIEYKDYDIIINFNKSDKEFSIEIIKKGKEDNIFISFSITKNIKLIENGQIPEKNKLGQKKNEESIKQKSDKKIDDAISNFHNNNCELPIMDTEELIKIYCLSEAEEYKTEIQNVCKKNLSKLVTGNKKLKKIGDKMNQYIKMYKLSPEYGDLKEFIKEEIRKISSTDNGLKKEAREYWEEYITNNSPTSLDDIKANVYLLGVEILEENFDKYDELKHLLDSIEKTGRILVNGGYLSIIIDKILEKIFNSEDIQNSEKEKSIEKMIYLYRKSCCTSYGKKIRSYIEESYSNNIIEEFKINSLFSLLDFGIDSEIYSNAMELISIRGDFDNLKRLINHINNTLEYINNKLESKKESNRESDIKEKEKLNKIKVKLSETREDSIYTQITYILEFKKGINNFNKTLKYYKKYGDYKEKVIKKLFSLSHSYNSCNELYRIMSYSEKDKKNNGDNDINYEKIGLDNKTKIDYIKKLLYKAKNFINIRKSIETDMSEEDNSSKLGKNTSLDIDRLVKLYSIVYKIKEKEQNSLENINSLEIDSEDKEKLLNSIINKLKSTTINFEIGIKVINHLKEEYKSGTRRIKYLYEELYNDIIFAIKNENKENYEKIYMLNELLSIYTDKRDTIVEEMKIYISDDSSLLAFSKANSKDKKLVDETSINNIDLITEFDTGFTIYKISANKKLADIVIELANDNSSSQRIYFELQDKEKKKKALKKVINNYNNIEDIDKIEEIFLDINSFFSKSEYKKYINQFLSNIYNYYKNLAENEKSKLDNNKILDFLLFIYINFSSGETYLRGEIVNDIVNKADNFEKSLETYIKVRDHKIKKQGSGNIKISGILNRLSENIITYLIDIFKKNKYKAFIDNTSLLIANGEEKIIEDLGKKLKNSISKIDQFDRLKKGIKSKIKDVAKDKKDLTESYRKQGGEKTNIKFHDYKIKFVEENDLSILGVLLEETRSHLFGKSSKTDELDINFEQLKDEFEESGKRETKKAIFRKMKTKAKESGIFENIFYVFERHNSINEGKSSKEEKMLFVKSIETASNSSEYYSIYKHANNLFKEENLSKEKKQYLKEKINNIENKIIETISSVKDILEVYNVFDSDKLLARIRFFLNEENSIENFKKAEKNIEIRKIILKTLTNKESNIKLNFNDWKFIYNTIKEKAEFEMFIKNIFDKILSSISITNDYIEVIKIYDNNKILSQNNKKLDLLKSKIRNDLGIFKKKSSLILRELGTLNNKELSNFIKEVTSDDEFDLGNIIKNIIDGTGERKDLIDKMIQILEYREKIAGNELLFKAYIYSENKNNLKAFYRELFSLDIDDINQIGEREIKDTFGIEKNELNLEIDRVKGMSLNLLREHWVTFKTDTINHWRKLIGSLDIKRDIQYGLVRKKLK